MYLCSRNVSITPAHQSGSIDPRISVCSGANNREAGCSELDKPVGDFVCIRLYERPCKHFASIVGCT